MRTNSRGSVVSGSEEVLKKEREALERARSVGLGSGSVDQLGSPPRSIRLEDRFEGLQIPEEAVVGSTDDEFSPRHSPLPPDNKEAPAGRESGGEANTETPQKGQITPPIVFNKVDEDLETTPTDPNTPSVKVKDYGDADMSTDSEVIETPESEATPRPIHTPSLGIDSEDTTPRQPGR